MRAILSLLLGGCIVISSFAQKPAAIAVKTEVKPIIDGVIDAGVWDKATVYNIEKSFDGEAPSVGNAGETNWRAMWDKDGIYIFINVADDVFVPQFSNTGTSYKYDFPEIVFDVNVNLRDGLGPQEGKGHYQIAPHIFEADVTGIAKKDADSIVTAFLVKDPKYTAEYFIPHSKLLDADGSRYDKAQEIGFDVYVVDNDNSLDLNDPIRNRAVWENEGFSGEAWDNMDACGTLVLEGAESNIAVEAITISAPENTISVDGKTMQFSYSLLPANATEITINWTVTKEDGTPGRSTISPKGLLTACVDETVNIQAVSGDGTVSSNKIKMVISGQKPTIARLSYIKNGFFDAVNADASPKEWGGFQTGTATVADGVLNFSAYTVMANIWDYKMLQILNVPYELKDMDYILSFKAWADEPRGFQLKIEDSNNSWSTYGLSMDETSNGSTFWPVDRLTLSTEPTVYELHMNFANMQPNCSQNLNWQVGESTIPIHLDSVYLISVEDKKLIDNATAIAANQKEMGFKLYPNPVIDKLTIELSNQASSIEIYNIQGIKVDEITIVGMRHSIDVSGYPSGIYFVKANNSIQKFIR